MKSFICSRWQKGNFIRHKTLKSRWQFHMYIHETKWVLDWSNFSIVLLRASNLFSHFIFSGESTEQITYYFFISRKINATFERTAECLNLQITCMNFDGKNFWNFFMNFLRKVRLRLEINPPECFRFIVFQIYIHFETVKFNFHVISETVVYFYSKFVKFPNWKHVKIIKNEFRKFLVSAFKTSSMLSVHDFLTSLKTNATSFVNTLKMLAQLTT